MLRKLAGYSAGLIALYIVVANASNAGKLMGTSGTTGRQIITAFQGR